MWAKKLEISFLGQFWRLILIDALKNGNKILPKFEILNFLGIKFEINHSAPIDDNTIP